MKLQSSLWPILYYLELRKFPRLTDFNFIFDISSNLLWKKLNKFMKKEKEKIFKWHVIPFVQHLKFWADRSHILTTSALYSRGQPSPRLCSTLSFTTSKSQLHFKCFLATISFYSSPCPPLSQPRELFDPSQTSHPSYFFPLPTLPSLSGWDFTDCLAYIFFPCHSTPLFVSPFIVLVGKTPTLVKSTPLTIHICAKQLNVACKEHTTLCLAMLFNAWTLSRLSAQAARATLFTLSIHSPPFEELFHFFLFPKTTNALPPLSIDLLLTSPRKWKQWKENAGRLHQPDLWSCLYLDLVLSLLL